MDFIFRYQIRKETKMRISPLGYTQQINQANRAKVNDPAFNGKLILTNPSSTKYDLWDYVNDITMQLVCSSGKAIESLVEAQHATLFFANSVDKKARALAEEANKAFTEHNLPLRMTFEEHTPFINF